MLQKFFYNRKLVVTIFVVLIVGLGLFAVAPVVYSAVMGSGIRTGGLSADSAEPATTDVNGEWQVVEGQGSNATAVGFTFFEILPAERKNTSGTTHDVTGGATVTDEQLTAGEITVDMTNIETDNQRRDVNVRRKILHTDEYPTSTFMVTEPADLSTLPEDGTAGKVTLTGDLTIHGTANEVTHEFDALRDGDQLILSGDVPINRLDYGVETPDFIAATIDEMGELNIRVTLEKN